MLTPPQHAVHILMLKISISLCRCRSEKLNRMTQRSFTQISFQQSNTQLHFSTVKYPTLSSNGRDPTATLNGRNSTLFSKSLNSQNHLFWAWCHPHSCLISSLGFIMTNGYCHIIKCTKWLKALPNWMIKYH